MSSANATDIDPEAVTDAMLAELKACFMEAYDDNQDGKIDIREVSKRVWIWRKIKIWTSFDLNFNWRGMVVLVRKLRLNMNQHSLFFPF